MRDYDFKRMGRSRVSKAKIQEGRMGKLEGIRVGDGVKIRWKREMPKESHLVKGSLLSKLGDESEMDDGIVLRKYWKLRAEEFRSTSGDRIYVKEYCIAIGSLSNEKHSVIKEEDIISIERVEVSVEEMLTCKNWEIREMIKCISELLGGRV